MSWGRKRGLEGRGRRRARFAPRIEGLEGRALLALLTVTSDADNGMGSLRAAVAAAGNGDVIDFDPGLNGQTITLTSGAIDIEKDLTIIGPGANQLTISGNQASSIFEINLPSVDIESLTLQDGSATVGGAIDDRNTGGKLSVSNCTFTDNVATAAMSAGVIAGGAIYSQTQLSVDQCTFSNNQVVADSPGGEYFSFGGAIEEDGTSLTVTNSTFDQNKALGADAPQGSDAYGGAVGMRSGDIFATQITATLTGDHFTSNAAMGGNSDDTSNGGAGSGGAVYINAGDVPSGTVKLSDNTFGGNSATGGAGRNGGEAEGGSITLDAGSSGVEFEVSNTHIDGGFVQGGDSLGGSTAGNGGVARGGSVALWAGNSTGAVFDLEQDWFVDTNAAGGQCSASTDGHAPPYQGGNAYGGGVFYSDEPAVAAGATPSPHLRVNSCQFTFDGAIGGEGRSAPAKKNNRNRPDSSFAGGDANGGGLAIIVGLSQSPSFTIDDTTFQQCSALGGFGGHGADNVGPNTFSNGGPGGKAFGGGMAFLNGPSFGATLDMRGCKFLTNSAIGGPGGDGGDQGTVQNGGSGGDGGAASGGGLEIQRIGGNPGPGGSLVSFQAAVRSSDFSGNRAQGGTGGHGGKGLSGGQGGTGGRAQGGGVDIEATNGNPEDQVTLEGDFFGNVNEPEQGNLAQGGDGGGGGGPAGYGGPGGPGGLGEGGGVSSLFSGTVLIENGQIEYNRAAGGAGGKGGWGGSDGASNFGYGGGVSAYSYTIGGVDEQTANLLIGMNVADVNPDVDGKLFSF